MGNPTRLAILENMYYRVRIVAGAKHEKIEDLGNGKYSIHTREPAEDNRANKAVLSILAGAVGRSPTALRIVSGHHAPTKLIEVRKASNPDKSVV